MKQQAFCKADRSEGLGRQVGHVIALSNNRDESESSGELAGMIELHS